MLATFGPAAAAETPSRLVSNAIIATVVARTKRVEVRLDRRAFIGENFTHLVR
jgi:hypothetical protein